MDFPRRLGPPKAGRGLCIIGNLTIDVIFRGIASMPEWGQEVLCDRRTEAVAGQAGGMAFAAARLGVPTEVVSVVGDDAAGRRVRDELQSAGVGTEAVTARPGSTALTVAMVRPDGERCFVSDLSCAKEMTVRSIGLDRPPVASAAVVALVGTANLPGLRLEDVAPLLAEVQEAGALTVFDPGWDPLGWSPATVRGVFTVLESVDVFLPNVDEARALTGEADVASMLQALVTRGPGTVVVKCGAGGSYGSDGQSVIRAEALPTEVDNAVGAGDVYDAGLVSGYLAGGDLADAMRLGTAAATLYVSRSHDRFPTSEESWALMGKVSVGTAPAAGF